MLVLVTKKPGWLGYIGDYTSQVYRDYFINHDILGSLLNNQDFMESNEG